MRSTAGIKVDKFTAAVAKMMRGYEEISLAEIKRRIEDTDIEDDERMEVLILILTLSMRAAVEKYLANQLMKVYFEEPEKEKQEKFKIQKQTVSRDKEDGISEL